MGITSSACIYFLLDESPLFLIKTGRYLEAEKIIERIFKVNCGSTQGDSLLGNGPREALQRGNFSK